MKCAKQCTVRYVQRSHLCRYTRRLSSSGRCFCFPRKSIASENNLRRSCVLNFQWINSRAYWEIAAWLCFLRWLDVIVTYLFRRYLRSILCFAMVSPQKIFVCPRCYRRARGWARNCLFWSSKVDSLSDLWRSLLILGLLLKLADYWLCRVRSTFLWC